MFEKEVLSTNEDISAGSKVHSGETGARALVRERRVALSGSDAEEQHRVQVLLHGNPENYHTL